MPRAVEIAEREAFGLSCSSRSIFAGVDVEKRIISPSYHHIVSLSPDRNSNIEDMSAVKAFSIYSSNGAIDFRV